LIQVFEGREDFSTNHIGCAVMLSSLRSRSLVAARRIVGSSTRPAFVRGRYFTTEVPSENKEEECKKKSPLASILCDWKYMVPAGILVGIPLISNEVIVLSEETQLLAVFMLFTGTLYTQVGGMAAKFFDEYRENVFKEQRAIDDAQIEQIRNSIEEHEKCLSLASDFEQFLAVKDASKRLAIEASNYEAKHAFRAAMIRKLEAVAATEETALQGIKGRMVNYVIDDVTNQFTTDKKAKENALNQALHVLANAKGPMGKDVVGEAVVGSIAKYRQEYSRTPEDKDPILLQLKRDVEAIIKA